MRFDIITLFPDLFAPFLSQGIIRRAFEDAEKIDVHLHQLRDYADGQYRRVDDRPYGGGPGMVMMAAPLERCLSSIKSERRAGNLSQGFSKKQGLNSAGNPPVIFFSPTGQTITHTVISHLASNSAGAILICGRYEGVDQRFVDHYVDMELSLGDFVLSGGEIPALALLDAIARLQPGVLGDALSSEQDSFSPVFGELLDYPHYTRPAELVFTDLQQVSEVVPPILLSGDHAAIELWRREQQLQLTAMRRPDLIKKALDSGVLDHKDKDFLKKIGYNCEP